MTRRRALAAERVIAALISIAAIGLAWLVVVPRGAVGGHDTEVPSSWSLLGEGLPCRVETNPEAPRSVRVDCYSVDGALYAHSHRYADLPSVFGPSWPARIRHDPRVRVQIDQRVYTLVAREVSDPVQRPRILGVRGHEAPPDAMALFRFGPAELKGREPR